MSESELPIWDSNALLHPALCLLSVFQVNRTHSMGMFVWLIAIHKHTSSVQHPQSGVIIGLCFDPTPEVEKVFEELRELRFVA